MTSENAIIRIAPDQVSCAVDGEVVILSTRNGTYYGLNSVGAKVWSRLTTDACSLRELCATIENEYDIAVAECEKDVRALVDELESAGLVVIDKSADDVVR